MSQQNSPQITVGDGDEGVNKDKRHIFSKNKLRQNKENGTAVTEKSYLIWKMITVVVVVVVVITGVISIKHSRHTKQPLKQTKTKTVKASDEPVISPSQASSETHLGTPAYTVPPPKKS